MALPPGLHGYFPGSDRRQHTHYEEALIQRALELRQRGYDVGAYLSPGDDYLGKVVEAGDLFYAHPNVPDHHFQQRMTEGYMTPPVMYPGGMQQRYDLEAAQYARLDNSDRLTPQQEGYARILNEVNRRAAAGYPLQRPRF
jgi:hypothetical protein